MRESLAAERHHAYATLMLEDREELVVVSWSLGHADPSTSAEVYAYLTPAMLERIRCTDGRDPRPAEDAASG